ncbi:Isoflavone 7-O-methyltransferase, partial [Mucuna pruriens]
MAVIQVRSLKVKLSCTDNCLPSLILCVSIPATKVVQVQSLMQYLAHNGFFEKVRIHDKREEKEAHALTVASELLDLIYGSFFPKTLHIYNESFNDAMASDSQMSNLALRDYNVIFEGLKSIVDVGGGTGTIAKIDRPHVVDSLSGSSNNLSYVGGDMFKSIPEADAILLKLILHNWTDNDCIKILNNCKKAISSDDKRGKVIVIDVVINENQDEHQVTTLKLLLDVNMACLNGKERSEEE